MIILNDKKAIEELNNKITEIQNNKNKAPKYLEVTISIPKIIAEKIIFKNLNTKDLKILTKNNKKRRKK